jgi:hypothetical protein
MFVPLALQVLAALRGKLESIGMARNGLAARLAQIKGEAGKPMGVKQRNINDTIHQLVQDVRAAIQVREAGCCDNEFGL